MKLRPGSTVKLSPAPPLALSLSPSPQAHDTTTVGGVLHVLTNLTAAAPPNDPISSTGAAAGESARDTPRGRG